MLLIREPWCGMEPSAMACPTRRAGCCGALDRALPSSFNRRKLSAHERGATCDLVPTMRERCASRSTQGVRDAPPDSSKEVYDVLLLAHPEICDTEEAAIKNRNRLS
ncbi:hypothetical protein HAX54_028265, partial [Datura stramonium]|nr:hypothetical protein [Datura stramonium]